MATVIEKAQISAAIRQSCGRNNVVVRWRDATNLFVDVISSLSTTVVADTAFAATERIMGEEGYPIIIRVSRPQITIAL
jgi:hypothetical protein